MSMLFKESNIYLYKIYWLEDVINGALLIPTPICLLNVYQFIIAKIIYGIVGLVQERHNSIANAL